MKNIKVISRISPYDLQKVKEVFDLLPDIKFEFIEVESYNNQHNEIFPTKQPQIDLITGKFENAILDDFADLAIYSGTDMPNTLSSGLEVICLFEATVQNDASPGDINSILKDHPPLISYPLNQTLKIVAKTEKTDLSSLFISIDIRSHYGRVTLVGFGPGDPELLTIAGERAIAGADIIFHDDLVDRDFLAKYTAEKVYVGKRRHCHSHEQNQINLLMLEAAKQGKDVVRLKGGDPMVFAHGGEEIEFLKSNYIPVKAIPGVSSGIAVASLSQIPLTLRGIAKSVAFITGHSADIQLPNVDTLVCFMAGTTIHSIAAKAIAEGHNPKTPVALVYNVSLPDQKEFLSTLENLRQGDEKYPTPVIIIIGDVVSFRK